MTKYLLPINKIAKKMIKRYNRFEVYKFQVIKKKLYMYNNLINAHLKYIEIKKLPSFKVMKKLLQ